MYLELSRWTWARVALSVCPHVIAPDWSVYENLSFIIPWIVFLFASSFIFSLHSTSSIVICFALVTQNIKNNKSWSRVILLVNDFISWMTNACGANSHATYATTKWEWEWQFGFIFVCGLKRIKYSYKHLSTINLCWPAFISVNASNKPFAFCLMITI